MCISHCKGCFHLKKFKVDQKQFFKTYRKWSTNVWDGPLSGFYEFDGRKRYYSCYHEDFNWEFWDDMETDDEILAAIVATDYGVELPERWQRTVEYFSKKWDRLAKQNLFSLYGKPYSGPAWRSYNVFDLAWHHWFSYPLVRVLGGVMHKFKWGSSMKLHWWWRDNMLENRKIVGRFSLK